jgi:phage-related protein (TIGR01555 family)
MLTAALAKLRMSERDPKRYQYPIQAPELAPGVVPKGVKPPVAMDAAISSYEYANSVNGYSYSSPDIFSGFPGYPYLALLSTRAEYRMFAQSMSTQLTREWIELNSTDTAGDDTKEKIAQILVDIKDLKLKDIIARMSEHDCYYGRAQMLLNLKGQDLETPLLVSDRTIKRIEPTAGITSMLTISAVEAMWTTPNAYNAIDPSKPDFYKPSAWFMLGTKVHASRLLTVITREVADMLKPAFNFGGISMSQLAEPYVDNWLRTRQSVSDLINNFSILSLKTAMDQVLQGGEGSPGSDGADLFRRAELFNLTRSNKGLMLLDKDREELDQIAVPLGGLDALQAQSQEQLCSVSHTPSTILLGVAPTGFGNVAEGEMRAFCDWIRALQYGFWGAPIRQVIDLIQMIRWGMIDPDITFEWEPLYQMTPKEEGDLRWADAQRDNAYIQAGVLDATEVREKLARDPDSGYQGLDITTVPGAGDEEFDENAEE